MSQSSLAWCWVWVLSGALVLAACKGSSARNGSDGGGGSTGAGGATNLDAGDASGPRDAAGGATGAPDAIGVGDAAPGSVSAMYRACVAYFRAECNRLNVCAGLAEVPDPCPLTTDGCPDSEFSSGSPRTVESLLACAGAWQTLSCADLASGNFPTCAGIPGTLGDGAPCTDNIQCKGTLCAKGTDAAHPKCGMCQTRLKTGDACAGVDSNCPYADDCRTGFCSPRKTTPALGQTCSAATGCSGSVCEGPDGGATCQAWPTLGQPCDVALHCQGSVCADATRVCEPFPVEGMPCKSTATAGYACAVGLDCDVHALGGPTCAAPAAPGAFCVAPIGVLTQSTCATGQACAGGICKRRRQEGDSCTDTTNDLCVPGTLCTNGVCVAVSQNEMTLTCGP